MKLSRRRFNAVVKLAEYKKGNSHVILTDKEFILVGSINDSDFSIMSINDKDGLRKKLLPVLESNTPILYEDSFLISSILPSIAAEIASHIPDGYIQAISQDMRHVFCSFNKHLLSSWDSSKLGFNDNISNHYSTLQNAYEYIRQSTYKILSIVEENKDGIVIEQPKIYLSGPISNNKDYINDFLNAEQELKDRGFSVLNPVELAKTIAQNKELSDSEIWQKSMEIDLNALVMEADEMALIDREEIASKGVAVEKAVADSFLINVNPVGSYRKRSKEERISEDEKFKLSHRGAVLAYALGIIG